MSDHAAASTTSDHAVDIDKHVRVYITVFVALMVLTVVTVGISRSDEGVMDRALVQAVLSAGAGRDVLSYRTLKVLADLDPAVEAVRGYTRYRIVGDSISIIDRGCISRDLPSRVNGHSTLRGTKRRVASER